MTYVFASYTVRVAPAGQSKWEKIGKTKEIAKKNLIYVTIARKKIKLCESERKTKLVSKNRLRRAHRKIYKLNYLVKQKVDNQFLKFCFDQKLDTSHKKKWEKNTINPTVLTNFHF